MKPHRLCPALSTWTGAVALAVLGLLAGPASAASTMVVDSLTLYRGGTSLDWLAERNILLHDTFDNNQPLQGAVLVDTGQAAQYLLLGVAAADAAAAATEANGQLRLDPTLATASANAAGAIGKSLRLQLLSDTQAAGLGLAQSTSFGVALELPVSDLPSLGFSFGMRLADGQSNLNDVLDLTISGTAAGLQLLSRRQDFQASTVSTVDQALLSVPAGAASLVLGFMHATPGSAVVQASWGFIDGQNSFVGGLPVFGADITLFHGEDHTQLLLRAVQAVPEPGSWVLMLVGLALTGLRLRLRRR